MNRARKEAPNSLRELVGRLQSGETSPTRVAAEALDRIDRTDSVIRAWEHIDAELVLAEAHSIEGTRSGPLWGVPLAVKDLIDVAGMPTRCGSELRSDRKAATADAVCVARARAVGAVPLGKTVTTEFGYFRPGPTRNPHALDHTPGGSSSGSAAAVAAGMVPFALGTQTAGSLTRPASYCGVAGFVTAKNAIPLDGVTGLSPSLDSLGLLAATVADLHFAWTALRHGASTDPVSARTAPRPLWVWSGAELGQLSSEMAAALHSTAAAVQAAGGMCRELRASDDIVALAHHHHTVMAYEAVRERAGEAAQPERISSALAELFDAGAATSVTEYRRALDAITDIRERMLSILDQVGMILGPAALGSAPRGIAATGSPVLSRPWQAMGFPVVTIPGNRDSSGLPLGLQLIARPGAENELFAGALWIEQLLC
ncbi:amidase [Nocardia sp. NPDC050793]|uniref:amidase n=1 Tax=Nocardia sp. NPDC050793 TaxID=3155159 RepID=UPI0033E712F3